MEDYVRIFDTTLRDGEQSPGATMTASEKLRIARKLDRMNVDVIEAGFPAASPGELKSVQQVCEVVQQAQVAALCRTREGDIRKSWEAVKDAVNPRIHVFIATSDIHMEHKLCMTREQVLEQIRFGVSLCRELCDNVEFSAEDATRSDLGFLTEAFVLAAECGATTLNVPDTVGYTMPAEYFTITKTIVQAVPDNVIISAHCHNDLGLAVANSLSAIAAGARQVEGCINGIGERAGNAAIEEVVMALRTRHDLTGIRTRVDNTQLLNASRLVSEITGLDVQRNKAIVGRNAFAHEAGIHQHGMLKQRETYEIMHPEDVGFSDTSLVLGKHSGKHALKSRFSELGYDVDEADMPALFDRFKALCDRKKEIYDEDLHAIIEAAGDNAEPWYRLEQVEFSSGTNVESRAVATVRCGDRTAVADATGDGPVNAAIEAIKKATAAEGTELVDYRLAAITGGSDAQGRVHLRIEREGIVARGNDTHTDVVIASAGAFVDALNNFIFQQERARQRAGAPEPNLRDAGTGV